MFSTQFKIPAFGNSFNELLLVLSIVKTATKYKFSVRDVNNCYASHTHVSVLSSIYYIPCKNNIGANNLTAQYNNLSYSKFCTSYSKTMSGWSSFLMVGLVQTQYKRHGCKTFSKDA